MRDPLLFSNFRLDDARRRRDGELQRFDECVNGSNGVLGGFDEFNPAAIEDGAFLQLADLAVRDAPLDHDRTLAKRETELVQRTEVQGEPGFHLRTTIAEIEDRHRFVDRDLPAHLSRRRDALAVSRVRHLLLRGASPLGLPHTLSREPVRRLAPVAWASAFARSATARPCRSLGVGGHSHARSPALLAMQRWSWMC